MYTNNRYCSGVYSLQTSDVTNMHTKAAIIAVAAITGDQRMNRKERGQFSI